MKHQFGVELAFVGIWIGFEEPIHLLFHGLQKGAGVFRDRNFVVDKQFEPFPIDIVGSYLSRKGEGEHLLNYRMNLSTNYHPFERFIARRRDLDPNIVVCGQFSARFARVDDASRLDDHGVALVFGSRDVFDAFLHDK